jgi:hypothetical protein
MNNEIKQITRNLNDQIESWTRDTFINEGFKIPEDSIQLAQYMKEKEISMEIHGDHKIMIYKIVQNRKQLGKDLKVDVESEKIIN